MKNKVFSLLKKFHAVASVFVIVLWVLIGTYSPARCPDFIPCELPETPQIVLFFETILGGVNIFSNTVLLVALMALIPFGVKWFITELRGFKFSSNKYKTVAVATAHLIGILLGLMVVLSAIF